MKKRNIIVVFMLITLISISSCTKKENDTIGDDTGDDKIQVSTTINPVDEIVNIIGKDKVKTNRMVPVGSDAHDFEPTIKDMGNLKNSKILFINGLEMETWVEKAVEVSGNQDLQLIDLSKNINLIELSDYEVENEEKDHNHEEDHNHEDEKDEDHDHKEDNNHGDDEDEDHNHSHEDEHNHGKYDPHIWLSLDALEIMGENVYDELSNISPENEKYFKDNLDNFKKDIDSMKKEYLEKFKPYKGKSFVTGHAAFGYLTREMGLVQKAIEGPFQEGEPTPQKLKDLIEYVEKNEINTIFLEEKASPKVSETLAREVNGKTVQINSLEDEGDLLPTLKENYEKILESFN